MSVLIGKVGERMPPFRGTIKAEKHRMPAPPRKPAHEMTDDELREWRQRLFTQGVNPAPIRHDAPASVSSYAWDPNLGATVEYANGRRYVVAIRDGKLTRLSTVELAEPVSKPESDSPPAVVKAPVTEDPKRQGIRNRKLA